MERYLEIINKFGFRNQMKKLHEETFEFLEAVDNYEDGKTFDYDYSTMVTLRDLMVDELGDVLLLLTQFIARYKIEKKELNQEMLKQCDIRILMEELHSATFKFLEAVDNLEDSISFDDDIDMYKTLRYLLIDKISIILNILTKFMRIYNIKDYELNEHMDYKLERTEQRIKEGYYEKN